MHRPHAVLELLLEVPAPQVRQRDHPVARGGPDAVAADDVGGRGGGEHGAGALVGVEGVEQVAGGVLDRAERAQLPPSEQRRDHRVGAEEARTAGDGLAVDDEVVHRHVVAAEAPRPGPGAGRVAEDPQVVHARITAAVAGEAGGEPLGAVEDVLQTHDRRGADVGRLGQPRREQAHRCALLVGPLLVDRQAAVVGGRVVPAHPLDVGGVRARPRPDAGGALLVVEAVDPRGGRLGHGRGDRARGRGGGHLIRCSWVITSPSAPPTRYSSSLPANSTRCPLPRCASRCPGLVQFS